MVSTYFWTLVSIPEVLKKPWMEFLGVFFPRVILVGIVICLILLLNNYTLSYFSLDILTVNSVLLYTHVGETAG